MLNLAIVFCLALFGVYCYNTQTKSKINTTVSAQKYNNSDLFGISCSQGARSAMEDAHCYDINDKYAFFGIFDGHGGREVADYTAANIQKNYDILFNSGLNQVSYLKVLLPNGLQMVSNLQNALGAAFCKTHNDLDSTRINSKEQGTTAIIALIKGKELFIANAGDSRAVLSKDKKAIQLSIDHKPDNPNERQRIEKLGGCIIHYGVARVNGMLAVSRAIGDKKLNPWVTPEPEIFSYPLYKSPDFLILACDGVWDVISNQKAVDIVSSALKSSNNDYNKAAYYLKEVALRYGSSDNVSVMVINLKKFS